MKVVWFLVLTFREKGKGPKTHTHSPEGRSSRQLVSFHWATLAIRAHPSSQSYFYWQHVKPYAPPYCQDTLPLSFLLLSSVRTSWSFHTHWIHTQSRTHAHTERFPQGNFPPSGKLPCLSLLHTVHLAAECTTVYPIKIFLNRSSWPKQLKSQSWQSPKRH